MQTFGSRVKPRLWVMPPLPRPPPCPFSPPLCLPEKKVTLRVLTTYLNVTITWTLQIQIPQSPVVLSHLPLHILSQ